MVKILLYAYCSGTLSSRRLEQATYEITLYRLLAANQHSDHDRLATFRQQHRRTFAASFMEVLALCRHVGLVKLGHAVVDGMKVLRSAPNHMAMSHSPKGKAKHTREQDVATLLAEAQQMDASEHALYGTAGGGTSCPQSYPAGRRQDYSKSSFACKGEEKTFLRLTVSGVLTNLLAIQHYFCWNCGPQLGPCALQAYSLAGVSVLNQSSDSERQVVVTMHCARV